jgi:uncharacterized protein (TIGR03083 family)
MIPQVERLAEAWASVADLCATLTDEEWRRPTGCPGWSVQDNLAHLVDLDTVLLAGGIPDLSSTEVGVGARRHLSGAELLAEYRDLVARRLAALGRLTEADLGRESPTPIGPGTLGDVLTIRLMDVWTHEQDMRRALGRPGHATGPVVDVAVEYLAQFVPFVVRRRAGLPEGTAIEVRIDGRPPIRVGPAERAPDVTLTMSATTFGALAAGRSDAPQGDVEVEGDTELADRVLAVLGFLP